MYVYCASARCRATTRCIRDLTLPPFPLLIVEVLYCLDGQVYPSNRRGFISGSHTLPELFPPLQGDSHRRQDRATWTLLRVKSVAPERGLIAPKTSSTRSNRSKRTAGFIWINEGCAALKHLCMLLCFNQGVHNEIQR